VGRLEAGEALEKAACGGIVSGVTAAALLFCLLAQDRSLYVWPEAKAIAEGDREAGPKLLAFCAERQVTRLYFMVAGKPTEALASFVRSAHEAKVQVHAMHPGDMAEWLDAFPAKLDPKGIVDWVAGIATSGLFDGVHLDIEPHSTEAWKTDRAKLMAGYLELLRLSRAAAGKLPLSAAVPDNWDREELKVGGRLLIEAVQDQVDWVSVMAYRGKNVTKVLEAIAHECAYRPGKVELIQETDPKAVEEGVALHVGTEGRLEEVFQAAREKYGDRLRLAVHHYTTWRDLPR